MAIEQSTTVKPNILPQQTERICYVESYGNYVKVYDDNGNVQIMRRSLKSLYKTLPSSWFIRIHNQRIVNLARIEKYDTTTQGIILSLRNIDAIFKVSRTYSKSFLAAYHAFVLNDIPFAKNDPGYCF